MDHQLEEAEPDRGIAPVKQRIIPAWTDYNDHLNVTWIAHLFDLGTDNLLNALGVGEAYAIRTRRSTFALGAHVTYLDEARLNEDVEVYSLLVGVDSKRIKYRHELIAASDRRAIARFEQVSMHVDLKARRSEPWPADVRRSLTAKVSSVEPDHLCDSLQLRLEPRHD